MSATTPYAPLTSIRIDERSMRVPPGYRLGDVCTRPDGNYWYAIRRRDRAAVLVRPTPCADEIPTLSRLRGLLDAACDRSKESSP